MVWIPLWFNIGQVKKVQIGSDQEMAQSELPLHLPSGGKKLIRQLSTYTMITCRKPSEQLFPYRRPLSYPNCTKHLKTYIRLKQHKIRFQHKKRLKPQQKCRLGTISNLKLLGGGGLNRFYRRLTSPSFSAVVHNIYLFI